MYQKINKIKLDSSDVYNAMTNCSYDWDNNEIIISVLFFNLDNLTNAECKILMKNVKSLFNLARLNPDDSTSASFYFMPKSSQTELDNMIYKEIDNFIKIKVGVVGKVQCESNIRLEEKTLFYE